MVPAAGVEPATFRSGGERSNPLSYAGLNQIAGFKEVPKKCTTVFTAFLYRSSITGLVLGGMGVRRKIDAINCFQSES